ncbi:MAG: hypothetical protein AAF830_17495 [Pseudomonadota bacterium]
MKHPLLLASSMLALVLVGCGEPAPEAEEVPAEEVIEETGPTTLEVSVSITLGSFEGEVTDLAAVEAVPLGFQGRILAANGQAGVQMIQVDGNYLGVLSPVLREERLAATKLASVYTFGTDGRALQFVPEPTGLSRIELVELDKQFAEAERTWSIDKRVVDLCVSADQAVVITSGGEAAGFTVSPEAPNGAPIRMIEGISGADRCFETSSALFVRTETELLNLRGDVPAGLGADVQGIAETAEEFVGVTVQNGQLLVGGEAVTIFDEDGIVILPKQILVEGGNFGGLLRDGIVAVLSEDDRLHLVAWSALANAVDAPRKAISRRMDAPSEASTLAVEEDLDALRPQRELPGFEEPELPEPPAGPGR